MNARYVSMKNWQKFVLPWLWLLARIVGPAGEYRDSVIQDWFDDGETLAHGFRRARKINDQRVRTSPGDAARDHRHRSVLQSLDAHCFSKSRRLAFDRLQGRFRSVVSWPQPGAPGRHNQIYMFQIGISAQLVRQRIQIVVNDFFGDDLSPQFSQKFRQRRAGLVFAFAAR